MKKELLFYNHINPKQYLSLLLENYPYDIEASMVYSLCNKDPYPHPVLCSFISYYENILKIHITSSKQESAVALHPLFLKMCILSQKDKGILHAYHFGFQAVYLIGLHPFSHPYAHLPFQKIACIDKIILYNKVKLSMSHYQDISIQKSRYFIYRDISMDANDFFAISIQITHKHGIIFLSKQCASLALPLCSMFHITTPCVHQDFLLIFGLADHENCMEYYVDETNDLYIGLVKGDTRFHHFLHLKNMILTLYNALCIHQHDLPIHASMLAFHYQNKQYGLLFAGESSTGKSEMLDAFIRLLQKQNVHYEALFDDHGTLHYLDNEIVSTAIEIGACKELSTQSYHDIFTSFHEGVLLEDEDHVFHQIAPLTTFEQTMKFHKITHFFYLDNIKKEQHIQRISSLATGLKLLQEGRYLDRQHKQKQHYFFNCCACVQEQDLIHSLVEEFITLFFVSSIPMYQLFTSATPYQKQTIYKSLTKEIFHKIL